jgi:hypothetical protein
MFLTFGRESGIYIRKAVLNQSSHISRNAFKIGHHGLRSFISVKISLLLHPNVRSGTENDVLKLCTW